MQRRELAREPVNSTADERRRAPVLVASAAIVVAAVAVAALVGVRGDFPLNDDWSYAWAARALCQEGRLRLLQWTGASILAQVGYGALLCRAFGFSFTLLRASTLVLATVGALAWYALLRRAGARGVTLAVATAVVALDPLYVNLAFTFMTDVPFTVFCVVAGWAYLRGIQEQRAGALLIGALAAAAALLVRQHGVFVAAAAVLAVALWDERPARRRAGAVLAAGLVPAVAFVAYHAWLFGLHGAPSAYTNKIGEAQHATALMLVNCTFRGIEYLGLLALPLAPSLLRDARTRRPRQLAAWTAALAAAAVALWVREGALLFNLPNVLYDFGVGPVSLRDTHVLGMPAPTALGLALRVPLTVAATVSAAALCTAVVDAALALRAQPRARRTPPAEAPAITETRERRGGGADGTVARRAGHAFLVLAAALLFAGTLLQARYYFDRYLLPVLPFVVAAVVAPMRTRRPTALGVALAAALAWVAIAGTHDYLAWNRARFRGLDDLARAGVPPTEIDGGFEFNAWYLAPELGEWPSDEAVRVGQPAERRSWWWVVDDRYVVSFRELPGYGVRAAIPFRRWLVPGTGRIVVLERAPRR